MAYSHPPEVLGNIRPELDRLAAAYMVQHLLYQSGAPTREKDAINDEILTLKSLAGAALSGIVNKHNAYFNSAILTPNTPGGEARWHTDFGPLVLVSNILTTQFAIGEFEPKCQNEHLSAFSERISEALARGELTLAQGLREGDVLLSEGTEITAGKPIESSLHRAIPNNTGQTISRVIAMGMRIDETTATGQRPVNSP